MVIFHSYVSLPEGIRSERHHPSVGQAGTEAGACEASGESHFGQGTLRLFFVEDIFKLDIPQFFPHV